MIKEKKKQGRPKKGKQPVQAAMESLGSSSESECAVRSRLQRVRQLPARFRADSSSVRLTVASSVQCQRTPKRECCSRFLGGLWKLW